MNVFLRVQDQREKRVRWIPFVGQEMTLGREPDNDLILLHSTVARKHCVIAKSEGQYQYQQLYRPLNGHAHDAPIQTEDWVPLPIYEQPDYSPIPIGEFTIALERYAHHPLGALEKVKRFLLEGTNETANRRLEAALSHAPLPNSLLHHFAVDCAERSLLREECAGREPSPQCWEALRIKRRWIEDKATEDERNTAQMAVEKEVFYCFEEDIFTEAHAGYAAVAAVAAAAQHGAVFGVESNAANWAADAAAAAATARIRQHAHQPRYKLHQLWRETREQEAAWQCTQLAARLTQTQRARRNLFAALSQRHTKQSQHIQKWHHAMEEALF